MSTFNYDIFVITIILKMDMFILSDPAATKLNNKTLMIIGLGIAGLYGLLKLFSHFGEDQEQQKFQQEVRKPAGIYNQGNTCFVNSLLQALASLKSFEQNLEQLIANLKPQISNHQELLIELASVMKKINSGSENISVDILLKLINNVKEGLINLQQQDAHELYAALIASFEEAINKQKNMDLSNSAKVEDDQKELENKLIGFTKSSIICTVCKNETTIKIHPFYDLSLEIRSQLVIDIPSALKEFQREQRVQNWTCTNCTILRHLQKLRNISAKLVGPNKEKLIFIAGAMAEYLESADRIEDDISEINAGLSNFVITFTNQYKSMAGDRERQLVFVEIEGVQTTIIKRTIITKFPKILVIHLKQLVINPITGQPQLLRKYIGFQETLTIPLKNGDKRYQLTSLLTHIGNQSMGHYYTFRRESRESKNWFMISDSMAKPCQWEYVRASRAYILFFETD